MTDEPEEGPDPNDVRRHAKRMHTEAQYRRRYRRLDFYRPSEKQIEFHGKTWTEVMLRAGNQLGKTHAVGAQMAMDALGLYPEWNTGRRIGAAPKIERPMDFLGWAACTTSVMTRDGVQTKLYGDVRQADGLGTGLIPLDNIIGRPTMARGIADFVDSATISREVGGKAIIRQKTFEMDRQAFQTEPVDRIWVDEDIGADPNGIYGEMVARITTTHGRIYCSMTPMLGLTPLRKRYKAGGPDIGEVLMTMPDCAVSKGGHIPDEEIAILLGRMKESERQTRGFGADMQGEGAVFEIPVDRIKHTLDPATFPPYWLWLWAVDFSHAGLSASGHPFAAVLGAWDRDTDTIYIVHAIRIRQALALNHAQAIKEHPMRDAPVAWPHDGGRAAGIVTGETIAATYKKLGLAMRPTHAVFPDGGYNFEAGITDMENRFGAAPCRLKVAAHLAEWFDEYQGYHRVNGLVHKVDDDLMSATRVLCMDIRNSKGMSDFAAVRRAGGSSRFAIGTPNHPDGAFDVFSGT